MFYFGIIISKVGAIIIYSVLILALLGMFYFIYKKRKQANDESNSIAGFNRKIQGIISKLDTADKKIEALKYAYERIDRNDDYDRNMAWKNSLKTTIYLYMIVSYNEMGDDDNVLNICNRILELNPKHAITFYNRGCLHNKREEYDAALSDFEKYLSLDKKDKWGLRVEVEGLIDKINSKV